MRLRRLDLTRYGKFTDHCIDFGEKVDGQPDLHIVYGANEAGKSTTFSAFLDLLFGMGTQSSYGFLHPYSTMRVGGAVDLGTETKQFARIKRPQNSLLDAEDRPVPESAIRGELGGIERDAYRTMFSLDDETLEKGGDSILASKGDLGQLLFSASAGLAHLSDKLAAIREEADAFYRYRARTGALAELKGRLSTLKAEREQLDTLATDYAALVETRELSKFQYDVAVGERARNRARLEEVQRHLAALPRLVTLGDLRNRLAPLERLPDAPLGWAEMLPQLQKEEIELAIKTKSAADEVAKLAADVAAIELDETVLGMADRVQRLAELRARYITADKDIPERRVQLRDVERTISMILQRIEGDETTDPGRFVLPASIVGELRELIETRSGLDTAKRGADHELEEARRRLNEAVERLPKQDDAPEGSPDDGRVMTELAAVVEALRNSDHQARQRLATRALTAKTDALNDRLQELSPWQGSADQLFALSCPSTEQLKQWRGQRDELRTTLAGYQSEFDRLTSLNRHLEAEQKSYVTVAGIVTDHDAAESRTRREQAWATHRRAMDADSADAFEDVMRRDDVIGAGRFAHVAEVAKLQHTEHALRVARADLNRSIELKEHATTALSAITEAVSKAVQRMGSAFDPEMPLLNLQDWLELRSKALAAREAARDAERDLSAAQTDTNLAAERLRAALADVRVKHDAATDFDRLLATAQAVLDQETGLRMLRAELGEKRRAVGSRERDVERANGNLRDWNSAWAGACKKCWLGDSSALPSISVVKEVLVAIAELSPAIDKQAGLVDRIDKMEKDQASFRQEVADLAAELSEPAAELSPLELAARLVAKVQKTAADRERRDELLERTKKAQALQTELAETAAIHDQQKNQMTAHFSVETLADVDSKLSELITRADLCRRVDAEVRAILEGVSAPDLKTAETMLAEADQSSLEAERNELSARVEDQDKHCQVLFAAWSSTNDQVEAVGGDAKVAAIEEKRRTTLLEIEDGALQYLQLRAGVVATEQALTAYRDRHRSSMMQRASTAFSTISRGAYTGLSTQPGKDGETLIALSAAGGSKAASQLSKGTRFQLYLALRVAGYHEFVQSRNSVPFVADDIMETFDDFRAEEAFRLFGDMALSGQVIYLTHHRHLCEIAKRACPSARLHQLG